MNEQTGKNPSLHNGIIEHGKIFVIQCYMIKGQL